MEIFELKARLTSAAERIESIIKDIEVESGVQVSSIDLQRISIAKVGSSENESILNVDLRVEI